MAATRSDLELIFRQLFVRNMSASDAQQASDRFLDLYFADGALDIGDADVSANTLTAANGITATAGGLEVTAGGLVVAEGNVVVDDNVSVTNGNLTITAGDLTISAGEVVVTAGNVNAAVGNIDDVVGTNANFTVGNITDAVGTNANFTTGNITDVVATNVNSTDNNLQYATFSTKKVTLTNVTGATCAAVNAIEANWFVIGVSANITAATTNCHNTNVGDGTDDDIFGILSTNTVGTNFKWDVFSPAVYNANTNVVLTAVGGGDYDGNGNVDIWITYIKPTAP